MNRWRGKVRGIVRIAGALGVALALLAACGSEGAGTPTQPDPDPVVPEEPPHIVIVEADWPVVAFENEGGVGFFKLVVYGQDANIPCVYDANGAHCPPTFEVGETEGVEVPAGWQEQVEYEPIDGVRVTRLVVLSRDPGSAVWRETDRDP